ncbi:MAG: hypothetical protein ACPG5B_11885 [Chitinophagales bacterium]
MNTLKYARFKVKQFLCYRFILTVMFLAFYNTVKKEKVSVLFLQQLKNAHTSSFIRIINTTFYVIFAITTTLLYFKQHHFKQLDRFILQIVETNTPKFKAVAQIVLFLNSDWHLLFPS